MSRLGQKVHIAGAVGGSGAGCCPLYLAENCGTSLDFQTPVEGWLVGTWTVVYYAWMVGTDPAVMFQLNFDSGVAYMDITVDAAIASLATNGMQATATGSFGGSYAAGAHTVICEWSNDGGATWTAGHLFKALLWAIPTDAMSEHIFTDTCG